MDNASLKRIKNFGNALAEFKKSARNLCDAWDNLDGCDRMEYHLFNEFCSSRKYPFRGSFDHVLGDIEYWVSALDHEIAIIEKEVCRK